MTAPELTIHGVADIKIERSKGALGSHWYTLTATDEHGRMLEVTMFCKAETRLLTVEPEKAAA